MIIQVIQEAVRCFFLFFSCFFFFFFFFPSTLQDSDIESPRQADADLMGLMVMQTVTG